MHYVNILFVLELSVENVQKCGSEKDEISLDKQGRKLIIWIKEKKTILVNSISLRGKERACIN